MSLRLLRGVFCTSPYTTLASGLGQQQMLLSTAAPAQIVGALLTIVPLCYFCVWFVLLRWFALDAPSNLERWKNSGGRIRMATMPFGAC